jgi:hypothetical protein
VMRHSVVGSLQDQRKLMVHTPLLTRRLLSLCRLPPVPPQTLSLTTTASVSPAAVLVNEQITLAVNVTNPNPEPVSVSITATPTGTALVSPGALVGGKVVITGTVPGAASGGSARLQRTVAVTGTGQLGFTFEGTASLSASTPSGPVVAPVSVGTINPLVNAVTVVSGMATAPAVPAEPFH